MKWFNLKKNKCPKCDKDFGFLAFSKPNYVICPNLDCGFAISHKRYSEIVNNQVNSQLEKELEKE